MLRTVPPDTLTDPSQAVGSLSARPNRMRKLSPPFRVTAALRLLWALVPWGNRTNATAATAISRPAVNHPLFMNPRDLLILYLRLPPHYMGNLSAARLGLPFGQSEES